MRSRIYFSLVVLASALLSACVTPSDSTSPVSSKTDQAANQLQVPVDYYQLDNGLRVVISPDDTAPLAVVGVYYNIGFRIEPKDRTGFAHLFEHMMFQGSENLGKMEFIQLINRNGGVLNGSTRFDFTNYFEIVPAHKLETVLWAEADRMRGLAITQENLENQQGVVKNEVKVNVLNQPYGGFPWLDMPQYAFKNWYNAHNFYGDLADLDAATLEDVQAFFDQYYAPSNAVLVISGDIDVADTKTMVETYFANLPKVEPVQLPDISEPEQTAEQRFNRYDKLAPKPALAFAYKMPERGTPEYYAMGLIDQLLVQGSASMLYQELVKEQSITGDVSGGINYLLGNMFNYNGPMLWMSSLTHDAEVNPDQIIAAIDGVIARLKSEPISQAELDRVLVQLRSSLYSTVDQTFGFGKVDLLASFALFDDAPENINELEAQFLAVTPELIQTTAQQYLSPSQRTILTLTPGADPADADKPASSAQGE